MGEKHPHSITLAYNDLKIPKAYIYTLELERKIN